MEMKTIYDVMEERLKDDARSLKTIKNLGKELIKKIKLIDEEIGLINPDHIINWNDLSEGDNHKLIELYKLKGQYKHQFNMITIVINKENRVVYNFTKDRFKDVGLSDKFFIDDIN